MGFFVALTDAQLDAYRDQIIADAASGVKRVVVDGESVELDDAVSRLRALDQIKATTTTPKPHFGMRTTRLISPGGWG